MENQLQVFANEKFGEVRTILKGGEPWFVGKDMVECLGYEINDKTTYRKYVDKFCDKEDIVDINKNSLPEWSAVVNYRELGQRGGYIINESGMYSLIFGSDLPQAKEFKKWVTGEVLPSLRKNGTYSIMTPNVNNNLTDLIQATITNIVPLIANEMGKLVIQSQDKINQSIELLHNQSVIYDADRENLKDLIGFHSVNTTRIVKTIKEMLSDKLGYNIMASNPTFLKVKKEIFREYKVIKWEDIPVEKYNSVFAFADEYINDEVVK